MTPTNLNNTLFLALTVSKIKYVLRAAWQKVWKEYCHPERSEGSFGILDNVEEILPPPTAGLRMIGYRVAPYGRNPTYSEKGR